MQNLSNYKGTGLLLFAFALVPACQTVKTGGKVVDQNRKEIIISSSNDPRSALPQGDKDSSFSSARERLEASSKANPRDIKTLLSLAELQLAQNRLDDAEASCRKALLIDLKNRDARRILAHAAIRRENYKLAKIFLTALGGEESRDSSVLNMLGLIAYNQKDYTEAMRLWKDAVNLNSGDISARMNLGVVYLKNRLFQKASSQFERILKIAPAHQDARLHLAVVEASRGQHQKALETYEALLSSDRDNQLALYNASVAQKSLGLYDEAISGLKSFIKASQSKSTGTDAAFAMIEEINAIKAANGESISDDELQTLAKELANRKTLKKSTNSDGEKATSAGSNQSSPTSVAKRVPSLNAPSGSQNDSAESIDERSSPANNDQDIEALEKQLKSPAH